jgi:uncharacterized PurR-regulated membrane protein YhhQ (DUF165 family)
MSYAALYVLSIALVNWGFAFVPLIHGWPPLSLAVGGVFALRDFGQRAIGHKILIAMAAGLVLSYVLASPFVAIASAAAFAVSEGSEWLIYTLTRRPFRDRVAWSVLGCSPVDSGLFLLMIGAFSPLAVATMTASKFVGAALVYGGLARFK